MAAVGTVQQGSGAANIHGCIFGPIQEKRLPQLLGLELTAAWLVLQEIVLWDFLSFIFEFLASGSPRPGYQHAGCPRGHA